MDAGKPGQPANRSAGEAADSDGRRAQSGTVSALVIGRLREGRPVEDVVRQVSKALGSEGVEVAARTVRRRRQLRRETRKAVAAGRTMVVCVGGDGAVREVATGLAGSSTTLGVIPIGTGNLFAGGLGIPKDRQRAVETLLSGSVRAVDCGVAKVDGRKRAFNVACGIGFDAGVMARTGRSAKRRWGVLAYVASAVREAGAMREARHTLKLDGRTVRLTAAEIMVANLGRVPPGLDFAGVEPDDGLLDVFAVRARNPVDALAAGFEALRGAGGSGRHRRIHRAKAKRIDIDAKPRRPVELDGSTVGQTPVRIKVRPGALRVMVPRG